MKRNSKEDKGLIIYFTKTGTTYDCAKKLEENISIPVDIVNIKKDKYGDLKQYSFIIIGTPIYMGSINKKIKSFCENNKDVLTTNIIGIFTCGLSTKEEADKILKDNLSNDILKNSKITAHFGGELRFEKMNMFARLIMKQMIKRQPMDFKINEKEVISFSKEINKLMGVK
jgi:menaquinone-dependent protoporphyrinogen oxidase